jgi:hypothetical protein
MYSFVGLLGDGTGAGGEKNAVRILVPDNGDHGPASVANAKSRMA